MHTITLRATDNSGNNKDSDPVVVTVDNSTAVPDSVSIQSIEYKNSTFIITWETSNDLDFNLYTLYESQYNDMSNKVELFNTNNRETNSFIVSNVNLNETRYYQVVVTDSPGLFTESEILYDMSQ